MNQELSDRLADRLTAVRAVCADAARRSGRTSEAVTLVAVSKFQPVERIIEAHRAGQIDFGENYAQEALAKQEQTPPELRWHFIGHPQTNKARFLAGRFHLIHSVDSFRLADALNRSAAKTGGIQPVLIQVNLAGEEQKSGVSSAEAESLLDHCRACPAIRVLGLMTMPPFFDAPERARPIFARLRETAETLRAATGMSLPELSMGMSGDFVQAIEEGATLVRVGTAIFGPRP